MEAYDIGKSDPSFGEKLGNGPCSSLPSLAHVLAIIITALLLIGTPYIYALSVLEAHTSLVVQLQAELHSVRQRVDHLESLHASQIRTDEEPDEQMRQFLLGSSHPKSKKDEWNGDSDSSEDFLEELFKDLELGSKVGADTDLQNTKPGYLDSEVVGRDSVRVADETEHTRAYPADYSEETPVRHHSDKLLTNRKQARDDVSLETANREPVVERSRRQAENRESRNRNRDRNRDRKASKGSGKRNRGNRGSTGTGEQEQHNGGVTAPPRTEAAFIHFVGNVSSLVDTHPERIHPLSPRMVNIPGNLMSDWAYAIWTTHRQKKKFQYDNGEVIVKEVGTYFIYSQVQFFDDERYTGHVITINGQETFKCAEGVPQTGTPRPRNMQTCYVGGLAYLHRDSRVAVRVAFPNRWVNMHHDSAYFGMYKVNF